MSVENKTVTDRSSTAAAESGAYRCRQRASEHGFRGLKAVVNDVVMLRTFLVDGFNPHALLPRHTQGHLSATLRFSVYC